MNSTVKLIAVSKRFNQRSARFHQLSAFVLFQALEIIEPVPDAGKLYEIPETRNISYRSHEK